MRGFDPGLMWSDLNEDSDWGLGVGGEGSAGSGRKNRSRNFVDVCPTVPESTFQ